MQGPGTKESSLAREINRPHMLQLRVHMRQPKIPHAKTKAPGSQKKKSLPAAGSGEEVAGTTSDPKGGKKQPLMQPKKQAKEMGRGR